jgi:hypothetical protein
MPVVVPVSRIASQNRRARGCAIVGGTVSGFGVIAQDQVSAAPYNSGIHLLSADDSIPARQHRNSQVNARPRRNPSPPAASSCAGVSESPLPDAGPGSR